jgi:hypothetical protein
MGHSKNSWATRTEGKKPKGPGIHKHNWHCKNKPQMVFAGSGIVLETPQQIAEWKSGPRIRKFEQDMAEARKDNGNKN